MTEQNQKQLGNTLWAIADQLRGAMDADDFRDYMLSFLFLRYLSDNYETAAKKELGKDYPVLNTDDGRVPLKHGTEMKQALRPDQALEWVIYSNEGHGWFNLKTHEDFWGRVERFLARHLAPAN